MNQTGVLIINVGTPKEPTTEAVRVYLKEFLTDPYVIQAPAWVRNWVFGRWIVPRRAKQSALKYKSIWTDQGSPLYVESRLFVEKLQNVMGSNYVVQLGMRYGEPSIPQALARLYASQVERLIVVPMFPQYAAVTADSGEEMVLSTLKDMGWKVPLEAVREFYNSEAYLQSASADLSQTRGSWDHLLFSFHGLPVSQIQQVPGCMTKPNCCETVEKEGRRCYRAQCYQTAKLLAAKLGLTQDEWSVSFQSRLGRARWIEPYTDAHLIQLAGQGVTRLGIYAPSFVVDGLETLEELALHGRKLFLEAGGREFTYISSLNAKPHWVEGFARHIHETLQKSQTENPAISLT
jgi:ferrochelatase